VSPPRIDLLFLCPLPEEAAALRRALERPRSVPLAGAIRAWTGGLAGRTVTVCHTGDGPAHARAAAGLASRARRTVVAGVAGALREDLQLGDLVVAEAVYDQATGARAGARGAARIGTSIGGVVAPVITATHIAGTPEARRRLAARWTPPPAAVDLETWPLLEAARETDAPWAVLRAISDRLGDTLPPFLEACQDRGGAIRRSAVLRASLAEPSAVPTLLRLRANLGVATRALAAAAADLADGGWCEGGAEGSGEVSRTAASDTTRLEETLDARDAVP
jgi:hypothetical protein